LRPWTEKNLPHKPKSKNGKNKRISHIEKTELLFGFVVNTLCTKLGSKNNILTNSKTFNFLSLKKYRYGRKTQGYRTKIFSGIENF
jgi:hypothetical protein